MTQKHRVVVVGSGLSGLEVATRLSRTGVEIVVLESGSDCGKEHESSHGLTHPRTRLWEGQHEPHFSGDHSGLKQRVGGRSLCWHGVVLELEEWALSEWPPAVVEDLFGEGLTSYVSVKRDLASWSRRPLNEWGETTCPASVIEELAAGLQCPVRRVPTATRELADRSQLPYSPLYAWKDSPTAHIVPLAPVIDVVTDNERVSGVRVGDSSFIPADSVLLAAGTIENARLLAQASDVASGTSLPGLTDHLVQGLMFRVPAARLRKAGLGDGAALHAYWQDVASRSNYFVQCAHLDETVAVVDLWAMGEMSRATCEVTFDAGRTGLRPKVHVRPTKDDLDVLSTQWEMLTTAAALLADAFGASLPSVPPVPLSSSAGSLSRVEEAARQAGFLAGSYSCPIGSVDHESGLLPLGGDLVDEHGRARAVPGLYVSGACLFPRTGAANPSLTVIALARRLADKIVEDLL